MRGDHFLDSGEFLVDFEVVVLALHIDLFIPEILEHGLVLLYPVESLV
jgi:hypothetical protein